MSAITGFYNASQNYLDTELYSRHILETMNKRLKRRGPDASKTCLFSCCGLAHSWLAVTDISCSSQIFTRKIGDNTYSITCDGELYNKKELLQKLAPSKSCCESQSKPSGTKTVSDNEVLLMGFLSNGPDFIKEVNGIFAIAIYDDANRSLYLFRDRSGIKPLFYGEMGETFLFGSELKAIFAFPGMTPFVDKKGLNEVFSIGPARTSGCGIYQGIHEVLPGHFLLCTPKNRRSACYWRLESKPHEDDYTATVSHVSELLQDSIARQVKADAPLCSFLSGGVDSSLVSAICGRELKKQGRQLTTYSFDFKDSGKYFKANSFQPSLDAPFVQKMVAFLDSDHHILECTTSEQADALFDSVKAHDLPNMADVDSSLLCFCKKVSKNHSIALTGECADEIFGGYPWFHKEECLNANTFPWTMDLNARKVLLSGDFIEYLGMEDYVAEAYHRSIAETPLLEGENSLEKRRRQISYLNLRWFMQTLLNRMDRDGAYSGLNARVPFADHRIIEYLWNVPWKMKASNQIVKGLLRDAGKGLLPDEILYRKKSPYPKTYDIGYEALLINRIRQMMEDSNAPVLQFLDKKKVETFLTSPSDYGKPWYGQLMAAPQMMAYILQVNFWLSEYKVKIIS